MKLQLKFSPELKAILARKPPANVRLKLLLIKERHLKRLYELSLKTVRQTPQLDEPNEEQLQWVERKMKGSSRNWQRWNEGSIYFTEEQKQRMDRMGIK